MVIRLQFDIDVDKMVNLTDTVAPNDCYVVAESLREWSAGVVLCLKRFCDYDGVGASLVLKPQESCGLPDTESPAVCVSWTSLLADAGTGHNRTSPLRVFKVADLPNQPLLNLATLPPLAAGRRLVLHIEATIHYSAKTQEMAFEQKVLTLERTPFSDCSFISDTGNEYHAQSRLMAEKSSYFARLIREYKSAGYTHIRMKMHLPDFDLYAFLSVVCEISTVEDYCYDCSRLLCLTRLSALYEFPKALQHCVSLLQRSTMIRADTVDDYLEMARVTNSYQLYEACIPALRNLHKSRSLKSSQAWKRLSQDNPVFLSQLVESLAMS